MNALLGVPPFDLDAKIALVQLLFSQEASVVFVLLIESSSRIGVQVIIFDGALTQ